MPVNAQTKSSPERLETILSLLNECLAILDKDGSLHLGRFTAKTFFRETLSWQTIVVKAHWIEDSFAAHTLKTRNNISLRVRVTVAEVQFAGNSGWWRINGVARASAMTNKSIQIMLGPKTSQARLGLVKVITVGQHAMVLLICLHKNTRGLLTRTRAALVVPPCFDTRPPTSFGQSILFTGTNGPHRNDLPHYGQHLSHSTSEPRSRGVSERDFHPMISLRWRTVSLYSAHSPSFLFLYFLYSDYSCTSPPCQCTWIRANMR